MERAYSLLTVKAVDEAERTIEGVASTPETDLCGDQVEPLGARFKLPLPLLWQHMHDQPIGHVEWAKPTATGIPFRARLARVTEPGLSETLKNRLDEAWAAIKIGLVRGVSIGFQAIKVEPIPTGMRFVEWSWHELSAVTIPANTSASISSVKAAFAASIRSDGTTPSPLWREVADAGQRAMTLTRGLPEYVRATAASRLAAESGSASMAMLKMLVGKVEALELQLAGSTTRYVGVWQTNAHYRRGDLVTHCGSIWHCDQPTNSKPGDDFNAWTLACRKGKDGKDGKDAR